MRYNNFNGFYRGYRLGRFMGSDLTRGMDEKQKKQAGRRFLVGFVILILMCLVLAIAAIAIAVSSTPTDVSHVLDNVHLAGKVTTLTLASDNTLIVNETLNTAHMSNKQIRADIVNDAYSVMNAAYIDNSDIRIEEVTFNVNGVYPHTQVSGQLGNAYLTHKNAMDNVGLAGNGTADSAWLQYDSTWYHIAIRK